MNKKFTHQRPPLSTITIKVLRIYSLRVKTDVLFTFYLLLHNNSFNVDRDMISCGKAAQHSRNSCLTPESHVPMAGKLLSTTCVLLLSPQPAKI